MAKDIWLFASDIHFPKHDPRMVELWMKVLKRIKPFAVDLVGDIDDACGTSRWVTGTADEHPIETDDGIIETRQFLKDIRGVVPSADLFFHEGNHDSYRHMNYIGKNAPALVNFFDAEMLYQYKDLGWGFGRYGEAPIKRYGGIYCHHGVSISKHAGESVRNDMDKYDVSLIRGHSHRQGVYKKTTMLRDLEGYEIGHMCDPSQMTYEQFHNWQPGFAYAYVDGDNVHVTIVPIKDYVCYVDGVKFKN